MSISIEEIIISIDVDILLNGSAECTTLLAPGFYIARLVSGSAGHYDFYKAESNWSPAKEPIARVGITIIDGKCAIS